MQLWTDCWFLDLLASCVHTHFYNGNVSFSKDELVASPPGNQAETTRVFLSRPSVSGVLESKRSNVCDQVKRDTRNHGAVGFIKALPEVSRPTIQTRSSCPPSPCDARPCSTQTRFPCIPTRRGPRRLLVKKQRWNFLTLKPSIPSIPRKGLREGIASSTTAPLCCGVPEEAGFLLVNRGPSLLPQQRQHRRAIEPLMNQLAEISNRR